MFCPQCGAKQASDEVRFCKACGGNLHAVRQVMTAREAGEGFDWSKTWVAEMFLSEEERKRRAAELERQRGITPEIKRYNEIKGGVITSCVGLGVSIFLYFLMEGIAQSGQNPPGDAEILRRIWIAGVIPLLIGLGIIINGLFISKRIVELTKREQQAGPDALGAGAPRQSLRSADTNEFIPAEFSVTEDTTKHLNTYGPETLKRDA